jgi:hypothetical protein
MEITTSLNRLHKFVERLSAKNNELKQEVIVLSQPVHVQLARGMTKVPLNQEERSKQAVDTMNKIFEISRTICGIKVKIMEANTKLGISALLVEQQQQAFGKTLTTQMKSYADRVNLTDKAVAQQMLNGMMTGEVDPMAVAMSGLDDTLVEKLDGILQEYTTRINEISDQVSDLNKEKVTVLVPDSLLPIVGVSNVG